MQITGRLENWVRQDVPGGYIIWGNLYDDIHGRWNDGQWIHTSLIKTAPTSFETDPQRTMVVTLNSIYELGKKGKTSEDL